MDNKRGGQGRGAYYSQKGSRRRSSNKKPPRGSWQPSVPSWEKTFCKVVGSLDWETLVDMKKYVHLYENVMKWDDLAGEEAFQNAKKRFLAKMHDLPCDISMPDPDLHIDEVDWDLKVDPELLMDLEYRYSVPDTTANNEPVVIFGDSLLRDQGFSATCCGDFGEDFRNAPNNNHNNQWEQSLCKSRETAKENGWGDFGGAPYVDGGAIGAAGWAASWENTCSWNHLEEDFSNATNSNLNDHNNQWEQSLCNSRRSAKENGWGDFGGALDVDGGAAEAAGWPASWENTWSWDHPENQKKSNNQRGDNSGARGTWDVKNAKKNHASRLLSSYRTSRFHSDEQTRGYAWRNGISQKRAACF